MLTRLKPKNGVTAADVAIRPMLADETTAILRAILEASDYGVLLTDLDHRSLACNRRFGEQFSVDPKRVVTYGVDELRTKVMPLIQDKERWIAQLNEIYADPDLVHEDELTLLKPSPLVLRRYTGPVHNADGELIGRLWTFRDITADQHRSRIAEALHEVSTFHHADPAVVYRKIVDVVAGFYEGTTAILSVLQQDFMEFRAVAGASELAKSLPGNALQDSYCQFALSTESPVLIQDAGKEAAYCQVKPAQLGLTRYLGVPVRSSNGEAIGTLCLLDEHSDRPLQEEDSRFLSLMAMRVGAELDREEYIRERLAEQRAEVERQSRDLALTHQVLDAMNSAFRLVTGAESTDQVIKEQVLLLKGLLGYEAAAILMRGPQQHRGFCISAGSKRPKQIALTINETPTLMGVIDECDKQAPQMRFFEAKEPTLSALGCKHVGVACVWREDDPIAILLLGRNDPPPLQDGHHATHLQALVDQVCLLLTSHLLHRQLLEANQELHEAQRQLVQSEKLSVVGTLAASTAHDIRNILSSLSLEIDAGESEPAESLQAVREQLGRFSVLAHRLLSYAKPRQIATQDVDLDSVLQKVISLTAAQLRVMGVQLTYVAPKNLPPLQADPHQLEHLFVNLILNGVQAMDQGGKLKVTVKPGRSQVTVVVTDTGKGIAKETAERLFQPFSSTRSEGFGLGLYSCKRIAEEHGGTISVRRNLPTGSSFIVVLPKPSGSNR